MGLYDDLPAARDGDRGAPSTSWARPGLAPAPRRPAAAAAPPPKRAAVAVAHAADPAPVDPVAGACVWAGA